MTSPGEDTLTAAESRRRWVGALLLLVFPVFGGITVLVVSAELRGGIEPPAVLSALVSWIERGPAAETDAVSRGRAAPDVSPAGSGKAPHHARAGEHPAQSLIPTVGLHIGRGHRYDFPPAGADLQALDRVAPPSGRTRDLAVLDATGEPVAIARVVQHDRDAGDSPSERLRHLEAVVLGSGAVSSPVKHETVGGISTLRFRLDRGRVRGVAWQHDGGYVVLLGQQPRVLVAVARRTLAP